MPSSLTARSLRRTQAAAIASALSCMARMASADDAGLRLHWTRGQGAERCVSGEFLEKELRESLGPSHDRAHPVSVEGVIELDARRAGFRACFSLLDASGRTLGTRELHSPERDCTRATPSLLLVLSVLAELAAADSEAQPLVSAQSGDAERPGHPVSLTVAAPPTAARRWELQSLAATGLALGMSPEASLGVIIGADLRTPWAVSASLRGMYWPAGESNFQRANGRLSAVDFKMFQAELAACLPVSAPRDFRLDVCWGATLLARYVRLSGLPVQHPSLRATPGVSAALVLAYAVSAPWSIQLMTSFIGLSRRDSYIYADAAGAAQPVYRASAIAAALSLGIGATL